MWCPSPELSEWVLWALISPVSDPYRVEQKPHSVGDWLGGEVEGFSGAYWERRGCRLETKKNFPLRVSLQKDRSDRKGSVLPGCQWPAGACLSSGKCKILLSFIAVERVGVKSCLGLERGERQVFSMFMLVLGNLRMKHLARGTSESEKNQHWEICARAELDWAVLEGIGGGDWEGCVCSGRCTWSLE